MLAGEERINVDNRTASKMHIGAYWSIKVFFLILILIIILVLWA